MQSMLLHGNLSMFVLVTLGHDHVALPGNMYTGNVQNMANIHTVNVYIIIRLHSKYRYLKHCSLLLLVNVTL